MKFPRNTAWLCAVIFSAATLIASAADELAWPPVTSQTRPWAWWWWHGSAVDKTNIDRELQRFHDAGLGGVQIIPIYGVKGWDDRNIHYLTPQWMTLLDDAVTRAHELGMGVDMTLGTGWCFGGPTVSDADANASVIVKTFNVNGGEKLKGKFKRDSIQALMAFSAGGKSVELTDKISADNSVDWTAPAGVWTVYQISQKPSGQKVKRAAPGGEGWMLNPLYPQAMRDWLPWFDAAFADYHGAKPRAVFQDSYEYRTDWAPDFFAQFEKRRGYKLQDELPALFGAAPNDLAARVKYDYRRTVSDVMAGESEPVWIAWAHKNGFITRYQAHGTPGNWLDLYADADVPETEMFHTDRNPLISKFASSAAHVTGKNLTSAETGTWLKEHFTVTLADVKHLADDMFISGVNHILYHGACYSPDGAAWPGWVFYASTEMNPRNSIWHDVRTVNDYIARCQSVLQSGKSDNDVLLYWPVADFWSNPSGLLLPMTVSATDWFEGQPIGKTAHELWNRGYAFDYVSDRQLQTAKVVDGNTAMPGGDYKVIVVPECKFMPLETFKQLLALAEQGATVIFVNQLPEDITVPGLSDLENRKAQFQQLAKLPFNHLHNSLFAAWSEAEIGKGRLLSSSSIESTLLGAKVEREKMTDAGLSFVRRSFDGGWNYFIVNRGATNYEGWLPLARSGNSAAILDPMTGKAGVAAFRETYDHKEVYLVLPAGGSLILRIFNNREIPGAAWNYWQTNGAPTEISGTWGVKFIEGGPTIPAPFQTAKLGSWTENGDTNAQNFAGTAKYEITFDAPDSAGKSYFLDLGDVRQSARVTLNGKDYGTLILSPFRVVVDHLKPTGNKLEVEITNVSANRIRDLDRRGVNWKIFKDANVVNENYKPFDAADWPLTASGLLGPVTLTPVTLEKSVTQ